VSNSTQDGTRRERIAVLGLGGGGGRVAAELVGLGAVEHLDVAAADTDLSALPNTPGLILIPLGQGWNCRHGCGGDAELGERAAAASAGELGQFIGGARLLLACVGLGGGAGSGAARVVARLARDADVPVFFLVTVPFGFEGNWRRRQAESALAPLRELSDAVIVVKNDLLFTTLAADTPAAEAFRSADRMLAEGIQGLTAMVWADYILTTDFAAIRAVLRHHADACHLGVGTGSGPDGWEQAVHAFIECPLVGGRAALDHTDAAVITLLSRNDIAVGDMQRCLSALQSYFPETARVLVGACRTSRCRAEIQITGVLCRQREAAARPGEEPAAAPLPATAIPPAAGKAAGKGRRKTAAVQAELPLQEVSLGMFSRSSPTVVNGENLDVPTFQRRGVFIDAGD